MGPDRDRVIVIGAGPVGLCLSLALAQQGIPVTLIEALGDDNFLEQVPRAGTNHPATLEMFDRIGLYARLEPRGIVAPVFHYWDRAENRLIAAFDHAHLKDDTRFPYVLQCERIKIVEEALAMAKAHPGIDLRLDVDLYAVRAGRVGRRRSCGRSGRRRAETVAGAYLVSCEGARSIVRKDLDIEFEGFTYSDLTLNIEVAYDFRRHGYAERNYISDPTEWSNLFHWKGPPDRWRVHFPVDPDGGPEAACRPEALQARMQGFLPTGRDFDIVGSNLYTVHQRVAKKFRLGRAILAGDAAHVNSPIGAMGMNSGVHDAFNLADKLLADPARRGRRRDARPLRTPAPPCRDPAHPGADHPQQAPARRDATRRCAGATRTNCAAPPKTRCRRAPSCCAPR